MTVSVALSEAMRNEIRMALEADGKPFTIAVARRVYDLAIASRDLLVTASGSSVKSAIEAIEDTGGPLDSTTGPSQTPAPSIVAETFGARMIRELLAALPVLRGDKKKDEDDARAIGADEGSFEHGFLDARASRVPWTTADSDYKTGYLEGTKSRFLKAQPIKMHQPDCLALAYNEDRECNLDCDKLPHINLTNPVVHRMDGPNCEAQGKCEDIKGDGTCFGCGRWLGDETSGKKFDRPPSGAENAFAPEVVP